MLTMHSKCLDVIVQIRLELYIGLVLAYKKYIFVEHLLFLKIISAFLYRFFSIRLNVQFITVMISEHHLIVT